MKRVICTLAIVALLAGVATAESVVDKISKSGTSTAIVLPEEVSPVLSRELVYTGVSRARERVTIFAAREVLREAIEHRVERASGLREALWDAS